MNEKPLPLFDRIAFFTGVKYTFSLQTEMKQVAVPDCRPEGIGRGAVLHSAKDSVNV